MWKAQGELTAQMNCIVRYVAGGKQKQTEQNKQERN